MRLTRQLGRPAMVAVTALLGILLATGLPLREARGQAPKQGGTVRVAHAPRADDAGSAGPDPRDGRADQQGHLREPDPARRGGGGEAPPRHRLGNLAGRQGLDVQAARRREVPRRDGLRRPGGEVHARPVRRRLGRRVVGPGLPRALRPLRGRRPAHDPHALQEAVPGAPRRARDRLPRHRLAGRRQAAREGVRPASGRHRALRVRELDARAAGHPEEEPRVRLGAGHDEAPGAGLRRPDRLPVHPRASDPPRHAGEGRGGRDRARARPGHRASPRGQALRRVPQHVQGRADDVPGERRQAADERPGGAPGDAVRDQPRGGGEGRHLRGLDGRLRAAQAHDLALLEGRRGDVPERPRQGPPDPRSGRVEAGG